MKATQRQPKPTGNGRLVLSYAINQVQTDSQKKDKVIRHILLALTHLDPHRDIYTIAHDLSSRARQGEQKYGTMLRENNGRDAMSDLYQEILDAIMYRTQMLMEEGEL